MKNKKLTRVLAVLVIVVWGSVAYRVYVSIVQTYGDVAAHASRIDISGKDMPVPYLYASDVRDPFRYVVSARKDSTKRAVHSATLAAWTPPPMKLAGVLAADKIKTAILERSDGVVFFVHEGDTLAGVKVLKIHDRMVRYTYRMKSDEWELRGE